MKVGGTQRRLAGALNFFGFASAAAFCFFLLSVDLRTLDSGTLVTPRV